MKPKIVVLAGPTASGKTTLAIAIAKKFPIEIVNADGLQVFREMDIGTAKPSRRIQENIPHHLIDVLNPDEPITAAWYSEKAREAIASIHGRGKIPLLVGGSGFYLRALEKPPHSVEATDTPELSDIESAYKTLKERDPEAAKRIHPNDRYRISRAMALIEKGVLPSVEYQKALTQNSPFDSEWIGLSWERSELHHRINQRVMAMFEKGLVLETEKILSRYPMSRKRLDRTIGYKEALQFVEKKIDLETAVRLTQEATRQYAKRQLTWFRKEKKIHWANEEEAFDVAMEIMEKVHS